MIQKKVCMLGAFSVGKTSLIQRFVSSIFEDRYLTTVGVKIDKKSLQVDGTDLMLMIWDLAGEDDFTEIKTSYLRGAAACIIVVDGSRAKTAEVATRINAMVQEKLGDIAVTVAVNKADIEDSWEIDINELKQALGERVHVTKTSAKSGAAVEEMFLEISHRTISNNNSKAA